MNLKFPSEVQNIVDSLLAMDITLYAVGGCVRDSILEIETTDFDLVTSNDASELIPYLGKINNYDSHYGIITKNIGKYSIEIARMRQDFDYKGRHSKINFVNSIQKDLPRRDFTINALAVNLHTNELIDIFDGTIDIKNRIIRAVGDPNIRFEEDAFRIIRAVSFANRLKFTIDDRTLLGIHKNIRNLNELSGGLLKKEFNRFLIEKNNSMLAYLIDKTGIINTLFCDIYEPFIIERKNENKLSGKNPSIVLTYLLLPYTDNIDDIFQRLCKFEFPKLFSRKVCANITFIKMICKIDETNINNIIDCIIEEIIDKPLELIELFGVSQTEFREFFPEFDKTQLLNGNQVEEIIDIGNRRKIGGYLKRLRHEQIKGHIKTKSQARKYINNLSSSDSDE